MFQLRGVHRHSFITSPKTHKRAFMTDYVKLFVVCILYCLYRFIKVNLFCLKMKNPTFLSEKWVLGEPLLFLLNPTPSIEPRLAVYINRGRFFRGHNGS